MADKKDESNENVEHGESQGCGWLGCRPKFLRPLASPFVLLLLVSGYFIVNSVVINGIYSSSISTIESRFSLTSSQMGMVTSIFDIAALIFIGPVSYFGARNKPVMLAAGMITMGIGYVFFLMPHFITKEYMPASRLGLSNFTSPLACASSSSRAPAAPCDASGETSMPYQFFLAGMFLAGAGCAPMISLGVPYMDENVSRENSPIFIGIFQTSGVLAAVVGFLLASAFLKIFVHPSASVSITPESPSWIGAWWLGFAIFSVFAFFVGISLSALPKALRSKTQKDPTNENSNCKEFEEERDEVFKPTLRGLPSALKQLTLDNPTFVLTSITVALQSLIISGGTAFQAKISLFQFRLTAAETSSLYGLAAGTGAICGNLAGSFVLKKFKLSVLGALRMIVAVSIITMLTSAINFVYCDTSPTVGINTKLLDSPRSADMSIYNQCNKNCSCSKNLFAPTCIDGLTYVNPCFAGCTRQKGPISFTNCLCTASVRNRNKTATIGQCKAPCGTQKTVFFIVLWVYGFSIMFMAAPAMVVTLRCVPFGLRSFAMGLQWMLVRVLGSIPGPILFGYIIDKACVLWVKSCRNSKGSCRIYKNKELATWIGSLFVSANGLITICCVLTYLSFKRRLAWDQELATECNQEKTDTKL